MTGETQLITVDPNGDTIIILKDPDTALLGWRDEDVLIKELGLFGARGNAQESTSEGAKEVRFLVSSRQLRIVSAYFDNMFKRDYSETVPCQEDNLYHVQAQHWSTRAIGVLLSISHQQVKSIPEKITPGLFAQIFVVADYYQMGDVLKIYAEKWWGQFKEPSSSLFNLSPIPKTYCENSVYWMFLAARFKDWNQFKDIATTVLHFARTPIQSLELPLDSKAQFCKLDGIRCNAIHTLLDGIKNLINRLLSEPERPCYKSKHCKAQGLGLLLRELNARDLLSIIFPYPRLPPFIGLYQSTLTAKVKEIPLIPFCGSMGCLQISAEIATINKRVDDCLELKPSDFGFPSSLK
ncbi:hypothetical protein TUN205_00016 [Pyrenophora tritici-repentis]|uniref:Uncharacterized protein n=2 Tax=Pyrenophora tritici-repentis TaxID=45151 RepID=A0A922T156_9PLEO|nr:uncharacterized protein PTRG_03817 [Pyrenophora tritici-repentis Pt-1C-BFP]EDU46655.1 predicted protein [Pyrenophora tritici-repentis Pt-1C-BFP]KAI0615641.1 hypothetical protein TUN205_00016 [Pyrenophora tritici-repentis]KAI1517120.1 hypothetical protein Ptr86124_004057 [Pyrenophora tritici-repentis]KAI1670328.1 hypothetical protein L13192_05844 [Pyrenophora tritici-repentis]